MGVSSWVSDGASEGVAVSGTSRLGDLLGRDTEADGTVRVGEGRLPPPLPQPLSSSTARMAIGRMDARTRAAAWI